MQTNIQLYQGAKDNKGSNNYTVQQAVDFIKYCTIQAQITAIQSCTNTDEKSFLKSKLPAVTWSGTFTKRKATECVTYSQLICIDIDKVADVQAVKNRIVQDAYTFICFISPSGNGLKVIIKTFAQPNTHKEVFNTIQQYYKSDFDIDIDPSGKDICRLCFLSADADIYVNEDANIFSHLPIEKALQNTSHQQHVKPFTKKETTDFQAIETCADVFSFTQKKIAYIEGNRNKFLYLFANNCNRKGLSMSDCAAYCFANFTDREPKEIRQTVENAYNNNINEHAKFKKTIKPPVSKNGNNKNGERSNENAAMQLPQPNGTPPAKPPTANNKTKKSGATPFTKFWKEQVITKGKGENKYTVTQYTVYRTGLAKFLFEQGYHLRNTDAKGYQVCYSKDGIIDPVDDWQVQSFVLQFCKKNCNEQVQEIIRTAQTRLFSKGELSGLDFKEIIIKKDTEAESFFYFNNAWVSVTKDAVTTLPYSKLQQYIWAGNKNKHNIKYTEPTILNNRGVLLPDAMDCEFARFVYYASYNPNSPAEKDFAPEIIDQRFTSFCSAIGFMLDGYKHPANRKGIFALDHKIGDRHEKNGRSGKSIIPQACSFLKVVCTINGKTHDPRYPFRYEPITVDAQIVNFNDMKQSFDVEEIFEVIADNYNVLRRNNGYLLFEYENSPKVWYSANGIPKGEGGSYRARMHMLEFSDYFNPEYTPFDEFGHGMFSSAWDEAEWNRFYSFMLWCVQVHKNDGLVAYPCSNFDARKLATEVNEDFIDYMDNLERDVRHLKEKIFEAFNNIHFKNNGNRIKAASFYKWTLMYCNNKKLFFNPHISFTERNPRRYDKGNGIEYYTLGTSEDLRPKEVIQTAML